MKSEIESPLPVVPTPSTIQQSIQQPIQQPTLPTSPPTAAPHVISAPLPSSNSAVSLMDSSTVLSMTGSDAECVPQRSSKKRGIEHLEEGGVNGGVVGFGEGEGKEIEVRRTKRLKVSPMETGDVVSTNSDTNTNRNISVVTDFLRDLVASDTVGSTTYLHITRLIQYLEAMPSHIDATMASDEDDTNDAHYCFHSNFSIEVDPTAHYCPSDIMINNVITEKDIEDDQKLRTSLIEEYAKRKKNHIVYATDEQVDAAGVATTAISNGSSIWGEDMYKDKWQCVCCKVHNDNSLTVCPICDSHHESDTL
jgi:hypothetical protein